MQGYKVQGLEILPQNGASNAWNGSRGYIVGYQELEFFLALESLEEIFSRSSGDTMTNVERGRVSES